MELECEVKLARHRIASGQQSEVEKSSKGQAKGYNEVIAAQMEKKIVSSLNNILSRTDSLDRHSMSNLAPNTNNIFF